MTDRISMFVILVTSVMIYTIVSLKGVEAFAVEGRGNIATLKQSLTSLPNIYDFGPYAWSADSTRIAIISSAGNELRVIDESSGNYLTIDLMPRLVENIVWSADGNFVAIKSVDNISIIDPTTKKLVYSVDWDEQKSDSIHPGTSIIFSNDDKSIYIDDSRPDRTGILLYRLNLSNNKFVSVLKTPFAGQRVVPASRNDAFQQVDGRAYYVPWLLRVDDKQFPAGSNNPMLATSPTSCIAFAISTDGIIDEIGRSDFPAIGTNGADDGSGDALNCVYNPSNESFEVARKLPRYVIVNGLPVTSDRGTYFESVQLDGGHLSGKAGPFDTTVGDLRASDIALLPKRGFAVAIVHSAESQRLVVWRLSDGQLVANGRPLRDRIRNIKVSPSEESISVEGDDGLHMFDFEGIK